MRFDLLIEDTHERSDAATRPPPYTAEAAAAENLMDLNQCVPQHQPQAPPDLLTPEVSSPPVLPPDLSMQPGKATNAIRRRTASSLDLEDRANSLYVHTETHNNTGAGWEMSMWKTGLYLALLALLSRWGWLAYQQLVQKSPSPDVQPQRKEEDPPPEHQGDSDKAAEESSWDTAESLLSFCLSFGKLVNLASALAPAAGK